MKIGIVGSMHYSEKMVEVADALRRLGHEPFHSKFAPAFLGKSDEEKEKLKIRQKRNEGAIREFWKAMQGADAILVLNFDRRGVKNYLGGNSLMEIGFAHVLGQRIFLFNPIPDIPYYASEVEAMKPTVINGDLTRIR